MSTQKNRKLLDEVRDLYKKVLKLPLADEINAVRAYKKVNVPVVMTRETCIG